MGRYEGTAKKIAMQLAATLQERASEEKAWEHTADGLVGNLQEFADDLNAALKAHAPTIDATLRATPWAKEMTSIVSTLSITCGDKIHDIPVVIPIGGDTITVSGTPVKRGDSAMEAVYREVQLYLSP